MSNVIEWIGYDQISYGKSPIDQIIVQGAKIDTDVSCAHCGKNIKSGKIAHCATRLLGGTPPNCKGDSGWGEMSHKKTFCSSSHARIYAKKKQWPLIN